MPRIGRAPRTGEHAEPFGQSFRELGRAHRPHPCRRQLERERHAVEPDADLGDRGRVCVVELEVVARGTGPFDEELHRGDLGQRGDRVGAIGRDRERRNRPHDLGRDAERLAARRQHAHIGAPPQDELHQLAGRVEHVLAVVEHEQEVLRSEQLDDRVGERPVWPLLHVERVADRR